MYGLYVTHGLHDDCKNNQVSNGLCVCATHGPRCKHDGYENNQVSKVLCKKHGPLCKHDGCNKVKYSDGLCAMHGHGAWSAV